MEEIKTYKITWNPRDNAGAIHFGLANGTGASVSVDSAQEMSMMVDILRNEAPVYWCPQNGFLMTGFEPVGEGANDADAPAKAAND